MNIKKFISRLKEEKADAGYAKVGTVKGDGKERLEMRPVPVAKTKERLNAAKPPKTVTVKGLGDRKEQKPTADVGGVTGDGIDFTGRRNVPVVKTNEQIDLLSDADLVL